MINDAIVEALVIISNHPEVKRACEPNVMQSLDLDEWAVKRVLYSLVLFQETWDKMRVGKGE